MSQPAADPSPRQRRALPLLLLAAALALGWMLLPLGSALLWAVILAMLFTPLQRRLLARLGGRRALAALLTLGVVLLIVVLPLALLSAALAREATAIYQRLQSGELNPALYLRGVFDALPAWAGALLDRVGLVDFDTLQRRLTAALVQASQFIATQAYSIGQGTFSVVFGLGLTLYLTFFGLRDGQALAAELARSAPLAPAHTRVLFETCVTVVRATVKGSLLVALAQGALGGAAFWALGVGGALLWAVLMALLSLLPAVGAALVWAPVALWFIADGQLWQGLGLIAYGVLVIGLVDNLLRPLLVGRSTLLPDVVVMVTTLGGLASFGLNGVVLGPALAALVVAVWRLGPGEHA